MAGALRIVDEFDAGFGWMLDGFLGRTSHALGADGRVWLVDPVDPAPADDELNLALERLGQPAGVIQLLDRHSRDCARFAERLGVPHVVAYAQDAIPDAPFELVRVLRRRQWREVALWWPDRRVLVCADALGTIGYFTGSRDRIGVHPLLRLTPPRRLGGLDPERILVGHGEGIDTDAAAALEEALRTARRRAVSVLAGAVAARRRARG